MMYYFNTPGISKDYFLKFKIKAKEYKISLAYTDIDGEETRLHLDYDDIIVSYLKKDNYNHLFINSDDSIYETFDLQSFCNFFQINASKQNSILCLSNSKEKLFEFKLFAI